MNMNAPSSARRWPGSLPQKSIWVLYALVLALAPLLFSGNHALTVLSQIGIAIIACLSYNMLLGQGGMLSFGHAVYTGLGAYMAMHVLNAVSHGGWPVPVSLVPLAGGLAGTGFAALFGYVTTRKAGTPFAMITLGMGELVFAMSLMFSDFFGGESGISGNRVVGPPTMGISFGPQIQVYYLIALYTLVCTGLMYAFTRTPLGRILNAVRDNPERAEFIGYNTTWVRYLAFVIAGFFAGVAGGLGALHFEIVTPEVVGSVRSGAYLLFTFLGGSTVFFGPIIGAVLMVLASVLLAEWTSAWLLYLGLIFLFMVMYAPGGLAGVILANLRVAACGHWRQLWVAYLALGATCLVVLLGAGALVEMVYHLQLNAAVGSELSFVGLNLNVSCADHWFGAVFLLATGLGLFELTRSQFKQQWAHVQAEMGNGIPQGRGQP